MEIPITLSDGDKSSFQKVESDHDERINLGDRFEHQNLIGKLPASKMLMEGAKFPKCRFDQKAWATRVDRVIIPLTMTDGESSDLRPSSVLQMKFFPVRARSR